MWYLLEIQTPHPLTFVPKYSPNKWNHGRYYDDIHILYQLQFLYFLDFDHHFDQPCSSDQICLFLSRHLNPNMWFYVSSTLFRVFQICEWELVDYTINYLALGVLFNRHIVSSAIFDKINKDYCFEDILFFYNIIHGITHSKIPAEFRGIIFIIISGDSFWVGNHLIIQYTSELYALVVVEANEHILNLFNDITTAQQHCNNYDCLDRLTLYDILYNESNLAHG